MENQLRECEERNSRKAEENQVPGEEERKEKGREEDRKEKEKGGRNTTTQMLTLNPQIEKGRSELHRVALAAGGVA